MFGDVSIGTVSVFDGYKRGESKDCDFMQFTGLLDKNWKEIYEGDIVQTEGTQLKEIVVWRQHLKSGHAPGFYLDCGDDECGACDFSFKGRNKHYAEVTDEVIGNIHENPELL